MDNGYLAWKIYAYLESFDYNDLNDGIGWLMASSEVYSVAIEAANYISGCGHAHDNEQRINKLLSDMSKELLRMQFAWRALHSFTTYFVPKAIDKQNSIDNFSRYLKNANLSDNLLPVSYKENVSTLVSIIRENEQYGNVLDSLELHSEKQDANNSYDIPGIGICIVNQIRNKYINDAMQYPDGEEESDYLYTDIDLFKTATQIILETIIILLIIDIKDKDDDLIISDEHYLITNSIGEPAIEYLRNLCISS